MSHRTTFIVSGNIAGGTSMTMRVLIEGGITWNGNNFRDEKTMKMLHNPHGCFEGVTLFKKDEEGNNLWNEENDGTCFKVFGSARLSSLPEGDYKIIKINRPYKDIIQSRSQRKQRRLKNNPELKMKSLGKDILEHITTKGEEVKEVISSRPDMQVLNIDFIKMNEDTVNEVQKIADFVAPHPFDIDKAIKAVDKSLYSKRDLNGNIEVK